ncbi:MAG: hypothetical protein HOP29_03190, partial [Phycisphaerales bacterium]|nr:hypothetical protein [Phycisphaerales bacterium]
MNTPTLLERRRLTTARRHRPSGPTAMVFRAGDGGVHGPDKPPRPTDVHLETTYPDGTLVEWFNDNWWLESIRRWKDRPLTLHIQRTPAALLHEDVAYELEMVRRMETPWRLVGHCYLSDIARPDGIRRLAVNHYDEI